MSDSIRERAALIARQIRDIVGNARPQLGLVLGSGWGAAADSFGDAVRIPFMQLHGMPLCGVPGHVGCFVCGTLGGKPAVAVQGRFHLYEGHDAAEAVLPVAILYELGARTLLLTNAAGSLRASDGAGKVMIVRDHINLTGRNPLIGLHADDKTVFVDLTHAYDAQLRASLREACRAAGVPQCEGVYAQLLGPSYETPAEVCALQRWGADAVGMSTALEAIYARYLGMRVAALSFLSNAAAGISAQEVSHTEVLERSNASAASLAALLRAFAERADV